MAQIHARTRTSNIETVYQPCHPVEPSVFGFSNGMKWWMKMLNVRRMFQMNGSVRIETLRIRPSIQSSDEPAHHCMYCISVECGRCGCGRHEMKSSKPNKYPHRKKFIHFIENGIVSYDMRVCGGYWVVGYQRHSEGDNVNTEPREYRQVYRIRRKEAKSDERKNANILDLRVQLPLFSSLYVDFRASSHKYKFTS